MKLLIFFGFLILGSACDYREYPQEEEWKEEFEKRIDDQEKN